jgi:hypothetical protein
MKDCIEDKYGLVDKPSYDQLRGWVREAWDALNEWQFEELLVTMPDRCAAVAAAEGVHTYIKGGFPFSSTAFLFLFPLPFPFPSSTPPRSLTLVHFGPLFTRYYGIGDEPG